MEMLLPNAKKSFLPELFVYLSASEGWDPMPMKTETGQLEITKHPFIPLFAMPLMISHPVLGAVPKN